MLKKIVIGFISVLSISSAYAANECIMLTNYNSAAVIFDSLVSPGTSYTVKSNESATLSADHMIGACMSTNKTCTVVISPLNFSETLIIRDLPPGTRIFYKESNDYYLDKNAHIKCEGLNIY